MVQPTIFQNLVFEQGCGSLSSEVSLILLNSHHYHFGLFVAFNQLLYEARRYALHSRPY